jgi:hypothetical protein
LLEWALGFSLVGGRDFNLGRCPTKYLPPIDPQTK